MATRRRLLESTRVQLEKNVVTVCLDNLTEANGAATHLRAMKGADVGHLITNKNIFSHVMHHHPNARIEEELAAEKLMILRIDIDAMRKNRTEIAGGQLNAGAGQGQGQGLETAAGTGLGRTLGNGFAIEDDPYSGAFFMFVLLIIGTKILQGPLSRLC